MIYTTNVIESLNAKLRSLVRSLGHFPNNEAAIKLLYLVLRDAPGAEDGRARMDRRQNPVRHLVLRTVQYRGIGDDNRPPTQDPRQARLV